MKKILITILLSLTLCACQPKDNKHTVVVGTIAGPETQLMHTAAQVALQQYHLHVKVVTFSDYILPNQALANGEIDANVFQHRPYLQAQVASHHYPIVAVGNTFLYPMGLYSKKLHTLAQLKNNAAVTIPNDPSNEARALLLLQSAKLITLKHNITINSTLADIATNPKQLRITPLDAAELPRSLDDASIAVINTNFLKLAGLSVKQALFVESSRSPYMNIIATTKKLQHSKKIQQLVQAYESPAVLAEARTLFGNNAIAGWQLKKT
jgi:D-methionine transport system substrate-binding protein